MITLWPLFLKLYLLWIVFYVLHLISSLLFLDCMCYDMFTKTFSLMHLKCPILNVGLIIYITKVREKKNYLIAVLWWWINLPYIRDFLLDDYCQKKIEFTQIGGGCWQFTWYSFFITWSTSSIHMLGHNVTWMHSLNRLHTCKWNDWN